MWNWVFKYSKEGVSSEVKQRLFTLQYYLANYKCQAITIQPLDISKSLLSEKLSKKIFVTPIVCKDHNRDIMHTY